MKKLLLSFGAIASVAAPIVAVVSCSSRNTGFIIDLYGVPKDETEREVYIDQQFGKLKSWASFHANDTIVIYVRTDEETLTNLTLKIGEEQMLWTWEDYKTFVSNTIPKAFLYITH